MFRTCWLVGLQTPFFGWVSVLRTWKFTYPPWRCMVGIQPFPFGTMGRPIFRCKLAATLLGTNISHQKSFLKMMFLFSRWAMLVPWRVVLGLRVNFIPFFPRVKPSRSPTSSTTMPPWLHVTWSGKKWWLRSLVSWFFNRQLLLGIRVVFPFFYQRDSGTVFVGWKNLGVVEIWVVILLLTPWRINIEPNNWGLLDDFSSLNLLIFRFQPLIFRGVYPPWI